MTQHRIRKGAARLDRPTTPAHFGRRSALDRAWPRANPRRPLIGNASSADRGRTSGELIEKVLFAVCCIAVPCGFALIAWVYCIYRLADSFTGQ
jgi:hypothetical protein